ncbi:MAG: Zn-dependent hydrolase [Pseudomonadota bacterium]
MDQDLPQLRINSSRLWQRLMAMARHGATAAGGCNRQALTDEDKAGRDLFVQWCREAGCSLRIDAIGNIFARREGLDSQAPPVITGSHLDTQPSGGKYDGIYGVLAGLEVMDTLNDARLDTTHPLETVVWTNEEGCRFDTAMMGSAVWAGLMPLADAYALQDRDGVSVQQELERIGYRGTTAASVSPVHAAFELHIEQGPVLEAENRDIGVVNGVQHMSRYRIEIEGVEAHAGPTPMPLRKDPMMALARFLPALYQLAEDHAPDGRITFGFIHAEPGSSNTVPGRLELTADLRHPDAGQYQSMVDALYDRVSKTCADLGLPCHIECFWEAPGVTFDQDCVDAVAAAVTKLDYTHRSIVSGAGHDACNLAAVVPTSMIFVPCEGGLSHNEAEAITEGQAEAGANVLLHAMLERARVVA